LIRESKDDTIVNTYRCALVGLSGIATSPATPTLGGGRSILPYSHASALAAIPQAEIVAVCDLFPAAIERFRERWGSRWPDARTYTDVAQMLDSEEIDILAICTPDDRHADIFVDAANRGIPAILCEKPLATTLDDADRMIAAADANGTIAAVEHTRRWDPYYHRVKELIDAGVIGEVKTVAGTLQGERAMLFRNGTHIVDLICFYAGAEPTHVFAHLEEGFDDFTEYRGDGGHDPGSEPGASAYITFANGARGFYNGTKGTPAHHEWDIAGSKGRIRISPAVAELWTFEESIGEMVQRVFPAGMVMTGAIQGAYLELMGALEGTASVRSTPRDGRNTVALLIGMLASHQAGNRLIDLASLGAPARMTEGVA
jgi:predicted dehydrogenase